jgi:hypothetical protein
MLPSPENFGFTNYLDNANRISFLQEKYFYEISNNNLAFRFFKMENILAHLN